MSLINRFNNWRQRPISEQLKSLSYNYRAIKLSLMDWISSPQTLRATLPWGKMEVGNDWLGKNIYVGSYEKKELIAVSRIAKPGWNYIDVGANIGYYSIFFSRSLGANMVYAFEPSPREFSRLNHNIRLNKIQNVKLFPVALGRENSQLTLYIHKSNFGKNSLVNPGDSDQSITVDVKRLDDVVGNLSPVNFIKIDVEGAEPFVLEGATKTIIQYKPVILYESWIYEHKPFDKEICHATNNIVDMGYEIFFIDEASMLVKALQGKEYKSGNILAIHKDNTTPYSGYIR
jgi:FkbM family methyltransferase